MKLAVIVPVYNERENIPLFYARAKPVLDAMAGVDAWALVFVNDGSQDGSFGAIQALRAADERVKVISLSRNFGYHSVLVAGLSQVESDLYAIIDVDGEDPPELLANFYQAIREGYAVAYGIRSNRDEPSVITFYRKLFYAIIRRIADAEMVEWMAEFVMFTRPVRQAVLAPRTTYPFLRAEIGYVGFKRIGIPYRRGKRMRGVSHYNLMRMTRFAIGGILSSSTFPLRFVLYSAIALAVAAPAAVWGGRLGADQAVGLIVALGFYFILMSVSMISLYLARTYKNLVGRPVFVIDHEQTQLDDLAAEPTAASRLRLRDSAGICRGDG